MLVELISRAALEDLAGTTAFRRGAQYFAVGAVGRLRATNDKITAPVEGTRTYQVELRDDDGDLAYDCTCPRAGDGYSRKHQTRAHADNYPALGVNPQSWGFARLQDYGIHCRIKQLLRRPSGTEIALQHPG